MNKNTIRISIGIAFLILISIGATYAYFTANLSGKETEATITVGGGTMNIYYSSGSSITVNNIFPGNGAIATKTFTVTGNNTTDLIMPYTIYLVVDENGFSENAISYKLDSTNTDNSGTVASSITTNTPLRAGTGTYEIGSGEFVNGTGKKHDYNLILHYLEIPENQNIDQGKKFKAHIEISGEEANQVVCDECLNTKILVQETGGVLAIKAKDNPDFAAISTLEDTGLYFTQDEYGTSYYYRGEKETLNNNLIFADFQWKIIRINGDGSIRLIYNGYCPSHDCQINSTGAATHISPSEWQLANGEDNKYLGYMYGGANGVASDCRNGLGCATDNVTSSNIKTKLELWYVNNILNKGERVTSKIADNLFCNDRQIISGTGIGKTPTNYAAYNRINTTKNPTLKCAQKNDRFTVNDTTIGNGALEYPIGLITADEASFAGLVYNIDNPTSYLYSSEHFTTFTPYFFDSTYLNGYISIISTNGDLSNYNIKSLINLRPVINLSSNVKVTGDGSVSNPFLVI